MAQNQKSYDNEFKAQAVKLTRKSAVIKLLGFWDSKGYYVHLDKSLQRGASQCK